MAGKRRHYILTETAERDFREAHRWSLSRWGKELTRQYFSDLHESAESIAQNHQRFTSAEHITRPQLSIHPVREHYVVYVPITGKRIVIVSLIRQTRDVPAILEASGFMIQRQLKEIFEKLERGKIPNLKG
ncbi:MAG: type II toxin-antitoxin system RelE/ParE family toxin [Gammaproteobacteria bacterium]|nr:type II toxin-antitoxin system RelE/ParE family toxin [Gammaproteobacteria bacterium]